MQIYFESISVESSLW